jgi:hypothetical protein
MKPLTRLVVVAALAFGAPGAIAHAGETTFMTLDEISSTIIGSTMTGTTHEGGTYTEYYAPDGTIRGATGDGARYTGTWWLRKEDELMCFRYGDGPFDAGCVRLALTGDRVDFVLLDGTVEPPATLLAGNPNNL